MPYLSVGTCHDARRLPPSCLRLVENTSLKQPIYEPLVHCRLTGIFYPAEMLTSFRNSVASCLTLENIKMVRPCVVAKHLARDSFGKRASGRVLHSFNYRLNRSAFCGIGGALRGCLGGVWEVSGGIWGCFRVYFVSETAEVELKSGRV